MSLLMLTVIDSHLNDNEHELYSDLRLTRAGDRSLLYIKSLFSYRKQIRSRAVPMLIFCWISHLPLIDSITSC
jgi:hypothetical protein